MKRLISKMALLIFGFSIFIGSVYGYNIEVKPGRISSNPNSDIAIRLYMSSNDISNQKDQGVWNYSNGKSNVRVAGKLSINEIYFHNQPNVSYRYDSKTSSYGYVYYQSIINEKENKANEINRLPLTTLSRVQTENMYGIAKDDGFNEYRYRNEDGSVYAVDYIISYNKYLELLDKVAYDRDVVYFTMPLAMQNRVYETSEELYQSAIDANNLKGDSDQNITSGINYYDNIMYLPTFANRHVYVRHIDVTDQVKNNITTLTPEMIETATKLLGNQSVSLGANRKAISAIKNLEGYQERYDIASIAEAKVSYSNNSKYDYVGYTMSKSTSFEEAKSDIENQINHNVLANLNDDREIKLQPSEVDDYIFIDFYYTKKEGNESLDDVNNVNGRLSVQNILKDYVNATLGEEDAVPVGSELRIGYTNGDTYKIGGLKYDENAGKLDIEVTINKKYKTNDDPSLNKVKSKVFKYSIDYSLYKLTNLKLYKISKLEIYDRASNVGGKLFKNSGETTEIGVTDQYINRFANFSTQVHNDNIEVIMNQKVYNLKSNNKEPLKLSYDIDLGTVENDDMVVAPERKDIPQIVATFKNDSLIVNGQPLLDGSTGTAVIQNGFLDKGNIALPGFDTWSYYAANSVRPKTSIDDFRERPLYNSEKNTYSTLKMLDNITNGLRKLTGKVYYDVIKNNTGIGRSNLNIGGDDFVDSLTGKQATVTTVTKDLKDTAEEKLVDDVVVHTPIIVNSTLSQGNNHWHYESAQEGKIIGKTGTITIKINNNGEHGIYGPIDTTKMVQWNFVKFDFDVIIRKETVSNFKKGDFVMAGTWIVVKPGNEVSVSLPDKEFNNVLNIGKNTYVVKSIAINSRTSPYNLFGAIMNNSIENIYEEPVQNEKRYDNKFNDGLLKEASYVVTNTYEVKIANRIFDFKVTNIKNSVYESLFKDGFAFYSGTKRYNPYDYTVDMENISGIDSKQVLPIGPKSLIGSNESVSPEIGSKISFDLKTTGKFGYMSDDTLRHIEIVPEYYYIEADGSQFYDETGIKLYYKDSNGKYVEMGSDKDSFRIRMTPRDSSRTNEAVLNGFNISNMSNYEMEIGNYKKLTLNKSNMAVGQNEYMQIWYGEYYLPESTIVVPSNVKNPKDKSALKNGYLVVKFNIKSVEKDGKVLSYQSNLSESNKNTKNEWILENYTMSFALANKKFNIDNDKKIDKFTGSVVIYDLSK